MPIDALVERTPHEAFLRAIASDERVAEFIDADGRFIESSRKTPAYKGFVDGYGSKPFISKTPTDSELFDHLSYCIWFEYGSRVRLADLNAIIAMSRLNTQRENVPSIRIDPILRFRIETGIQSHHL